MKKTIIKVLAGLAIALFVGASVYADLHLRQTNPDYAEAPVLGE